VRQVMLCEEDNDQASTREPEINFNLKWDVKRVLIDPESTADIL